MAVLQTLLLTCVATAALATRAALACDKVWNDVCFTYAAGDDVFWGSNCDLGGADSGGSARGGADKCGALCRARGNACARWSWNDYLGGTCYFKAGTPWTLVAAPGVQCGFRKFPEH